MEQKKDISGNLVDFNTLKRLLVFAKPYKVQYWLLILLTVALAALIPWKPYLIHKTIDVELVNKDYNGLVNMILLLLILTIAQALLQYFHTYLSGWLGQYIIRDIRIKLFSHIQKLNLRFFDKTPIGRLVTRNISDIETLADVFSQGIAELIGDLLQLIVLLSFMFYVDWKLTLISLATLPILIFATYIFKEKIKKSFNEVRNAVSNLNTFVQEHVTGMSIVQIFNSEKREYDKFKVINEEHRKANIKSVWYYSVYYPVAEVIQAMGIGLVVWFGAGEVIQENIQLGVLIAFIMYIQMFFRPIRMIADRFNTLQMGIVSTHRIIDLMDNKEMIPNNGTIIKEHFRGDIAFKDVWFAYNDKEWVLKNINFKVNEGQTLAIVGATGSGKSTIINLLNRFYDIDKGEILMDGVKIQDYTIESLRHNIGIVLQDVFLFSDTIYNNITLRNSNIDRDQVFRAAEIIGANNFIEKLDEGLDYKLTERGSNLSTGQRQLISFMRALVYDPKIIVLDEATSSVDTETESLIQHAINKLLVGRTSIVIAHRLSTIQNASNIIVLDKGEIKEIGTHKELLAKKSYYSHLYHLQFKEIKESLTAIS